MVYIYAAGNVQDHEPERRYVAMDWLGPLLSDYRYAFTLFARGLVGVGIFWGAATIIRWRRDGIRSALMRSVPEAVIAASLVAIWVFTVAPLIRFLPGEQAQHVPVNLVPVLPLIGGLMSTNGWRENAPNLIANLLLYVPLAVGLRWRFGLQVRWVVVIAACLSGAVEAWQAVSDQMRTSDINDVLLNTTGAIVGAWSFSVAERTFRRLGDVDSPPDVKVGACAPEQSRPTNPERLTDTV